MKILLILLLSAVFLMAKSDETCYTVQLISKYNTQENRELFSKENYDKSCKLMEIGKTLTVRCGCFEKKESAQDSLKDFKKDYLQSIVSSTYKYRFDDNNSEIDSKSIVEKSISLPSLNTEVAKESKKVNNHKVCYTVQLVSLNNSRDNLDLLNKSSYPDSCSLMEIGSNYTVRCGCYDQREKIKDEFELLKKNYLNAAIARTYKYRFDKDTKIQSKKHSIKEQSKKIVSLSTRDEELRLILQVFLYKGDLENAYTVAKLGYSRDNNSYYWNQKMAEISQWTNRSSQSMQHLRTMYNIKYDQEIEQKLITYGVEYYQYEEVEDLVVNKALNNPTEKNIDMMIFIYKKIGEPEKVVAVLENEYNKDSTNTMFLTKALALSLEIGDLEISEKFVNILESKKTYSQKDAALIANYYYIRHDIEKSYKSLSYVNKLNIVNIDDYVKYFELQSDLGWYLQDNVNAAIASQELMRLGHARLVDYERISYVYKEKDPKLAGESSKKAYEKYKLSYLFYSYANYAINMKQFGELQELIDSIEHKKSTITNESLFWIIKSKLYSHYKEYDLTEKALQKALSISSNYEIKVILLTHYIERNKEEKLKMLLAEMEAGEVDVSYYFPFASAYYNLQNIDRASYYLQKLLFINDPITKLLEFRFMQAYIYQVQNNEEAFKSSMQSIVDELEDEAKENKKLLMQNRFLNQYLRAAINIYNTDKFQKKLDKAKKYLTKQNYREISYSLAMKNSAYEKSHKIYQKIEKKDLWLKFSNSLLFQNHSEIEDLLEYRLKSLSKGDVVQAAYSDGQTSLAQSISFEILSINNNNQNAYIQHMNLSKERSDLLESKLLYNDRDSLLQKSLKIDNSLYIRDNYYMNIGVEHRINTILDEKILLYTPQTSTYLNLGVKKLFNRTSIQAELLYCNSVESNYGFKAEIQHRLSTDLIADIKIQNNVKSEESTALIVGGMKDTISANLQWRLLNSTTLDLLYDKNYYNSQDSVALGEGFYFKAALMYQIRNSYPDMRVDVFYDRAENRENDGSRGVVDLIQDNRYNILEKEYYNVGLNFAYGIVNSTLYTRVWRPYFVFSPSYNSVLDTYNFGFHLGVGGKILHQDHLSLGLQYSDSEDGIVGKSVQFYLKYNFLYAHPKITKGF